MKKLLIASLVLFGLTGGYLLYSGYSEVRLSTMEQWNAQQITLASQAAVGIEGFFEHNRNILHYLAKNSHIIAMDETGRRIMRRYFSFNAQTIKALTRVDKNGRLIYTVPFNPEIIGSDMSGQAHNAFIMRTHKPVVSEVFTSVQGYQAVAYTVPVFENAEYRGCLTILIPFRHLAASYLEAMKLGPGGHAWVMSKGGQVLFRSRGCKITPELISGKQACASLGDLTQKILQGGQGTGWFQCSSLPGAKPETGVRRLVYYPVGLDQTHWSICIAAPESQILANMEGFADRWLITVLVFIGGGLIFSFLLIKTWVAVAEVKRRKAAEGALNQSEEKYRSLVEKVPYGLFMAALPSGRFLFLNERICELFGYSMSQGLKMRIWDVIDPREHQLVQDNIAMRKAGELEPQASLPYTCICQDGSTLRCDVSVSVLDSSEGPVLQGILRDISEQEKLEKQLLHSQKMEAVGTLSSGIAHDFNNLLQVISGFVQLAGAQGKLDPKTRHYLEEIENSAQRGSDLVRRLLTFSRKVESDSKPVDTNSEVSQAVKLLERTLPKMISIETNLGLGLPPINCDPTQLVQVVVNLGSNAGDAMPGGGRLIIETSLTPVDPDLLKSQAVTTRGPFVKIRVSDTGSGMDDDTLAHVFDPFFTTKEVGKGTGLGLSIVYGIVHAHNGFIELHSPKNRGTVVEVYFPVPEDPHQRVEPAPAQPAILASGTEGVLMVDDEANILEIGREALVGQGYTVFLASQGEAALELIGEKAGEIDLVILDLGMPGIGGKNTLAQIMEMSPGTRVLVASGYSSQGLESELLAAGASGFLQKPYKLPELLEKVRAILDR